MLFAVIFTDKPDHGELRARNLDAHIHWIRQNSNLILVAGSLRVEPGDIPTGGLWIVEAQSKSAVHELMKTDPFFVCGLRQSVEVLHWSKALQDRKVLV